MAEYGEPLTEREIELLQLVATGITNRQIAYQLSISVNTVKVHLRNIYAKLGAESRTEAAMMAIRAGWITVTEAKEATTESVEAAPGEPVGETVAELTEEPVEEPVEPPPPLPWPYRLALVGVALLVVLVTLASGLPGRASLSNSGANEGLPLNGVRDPSITENILIDRDSPWRELAQMPTRRAHFAIASVGGRIFTIAGQVATGVTAKMEIYDPKDDIWSRGLDKSLPVMYVAAAVVDGDIYVPGGCDANGTPTDIVEVYRTTEQTWQTVSPLPEARCAGAVTAIGEHIYVFGGWDGRRYVSTVYAYDSLSDTWEERMPMAVNRGFAAATQLEGVAFVVGGYDGEHELKTCSQYLPDQDAWISCAPLSIGRGGLGLVSMGGSLFAIGGGGWSSYLGFNERYQPTTDVWETIETPLVAEWRGPGVVAGGTSIYAIGGWSGNLLSINQVYEPLAFRIFIPVSQ